MCLCEPRLLHSRINNLHAAKPLMLMVIPVLWLEDFYFLEEHFIRPPYDGSEILRKCQDGFFRKIAFEMRWVVMISLTSVFLLSLLLFLSSEFNSKYFFELFHKIGVEDNKNGPQME